MVKSSIVVEFVLDGQHMVILLLFTLDRLHLLSVVSNSVLLLTDKVSEFHLLLYQVFSLGKRPNKLVLLLLLNAQDLMMMANVDTL